MADITTFFNTSTYQGDWKQDGSALASGDDLSTAILISLFTDRTAAQSDDTPDGDLRGWWGDDAPKYPIGSRLWLLERVKGPEDVPQRARDYAKEALQWLIDDGVVASFDIASQWVPPNRLDLLITANKPDGTKIPLRFANVWKS